MIAKRSLLTLHRRVAIAAVLFLLVQAASGIALSWRWEFARLIDPAGMSGSPAAEDVSIEARLASLANSFPEAADLRIFFPQSERGVYLVRIQTPGGIRYTSVHPADGRVLRQGSVWRFPSEAALKLHYQPLTGWPGYLWVMALGIALITLLLTGLEYWRQAAGGWQRKLQVEYRAPRARMLRQLHRSLGILALPLLLVIALTGIVLAGELLAGALGTPASAPEYSRPELSGLDRAVAAARTSFPASQVRDIRISPQGEAAIQLWTPGTSPWAIHRVTLDLDDPKQLDRLAADERQALWPLLLPVHTGSILGGTGRWLATGTAGAFLLLASLGGYLWLKRARRPRR